jgi:hypothetical protein
VHGKQLNRTIDVVGRIGGWRAIHDALAIERKLRKARGQLADSARVCLDDHLKGNDFVAGAEDARHTAVPDRIAHAERMVLCVAFDLVPVADGPHTADTCLRGRRHQKESGRNQHAHYCVTSSCRASACERFLSG